MKQEVQYRQVTIHFIFGNDIMGALAIDILYYTGKVQWGNIVKTTLKEQGLLMDKETSEMHYLMATDSPILQQNEEDIGLWNFLQIPKWVLVPEEVSFPLCWTL